MLLFMRLLWRGEIDLPVAFWGGAVLFNLVLIDRVGITLIGLAESGFLVRFYTALIVLLNAYVLPGVWRSAVYWPGDPHWARLAQLMCVLLAARVTYTFVTLWLGGEQSLTTTP